MIKLAESQMDLNPILSRLEESLNRPALGRGTGADDVPAHIRNIDIHLARLLEETATGRSEMIDELRSEIRVLSRTLAAIAEKAGR